ncbi:MAG: glycosyltransferase family 4 protein [Kordiimonadaceae bacterium]|nr:glycosyltransferase family 4 protein [Kordiimonadaceae bacterium]
MKIGTIYYLIPDIFRQKFSLRQFLRALRQGNGIDYIKACFKDRKKAVGGVKVFYQHVKLLRELGYNADVLALGSFDGNIYYPDITALNIRDFGCDLKENDVVVASEFFPYDALKFKNAIKIMFAQSWVFLKMTLNEQDREKSYRDLGYDYVISCGDYITRTIKAVNGEDCITISNGIDDSVFFPDPALREKNTVLCLPRKNPQDIDMIRKIVEREIPYVRFKYADGLDEAGIADAFRRADIMLASGYPEGLPLPPLEAMFSGAVVVGFAGRGGRQFMINEKTALVSEDGDCVSAAENLISILKNDEQKERLRENALQFVLESYKIDDLKDRLKSFYDMISDPTIK